jgi:hypothetical protein
MLPPSQVTQLADNVYNIYQFTARTSTYAAILERYNTVGSLLVWQVEQDACAQTNTMRLRFLGGIELVTPNVSYEVRYYGFFVPGQKYVMALFTKGALSSEPYTLTLKELNGTP